MSCILGKNFTIEPYPQIPMRRVCVCGVCMCSCGICTHTCSYKCCGGQRLTYLLCFPLFKIIFYYYHLLLCVHATACMEDHGTTLAWVLFIHLSLPESKLKWQCLYGKDLNPLTNHLKSPVQPSPSLFKTFTYLFSMDVNTCVHAL